MIPIGPKQRKGAKQAAGQLAPPRSAERPCRWFEFLRLWWEGFD